MVSSATSAKTNREQALNDKGSGEWLDMAQTSNGPRWNGFAADGLLARPDARNATR